MKFEIEPLTPESFAPFGRVIAPDGSPSPQRFEMAFEHGGAAERPGLALATIEAAVELPFAIAQLERHPHSAQTFLPLVGEAGLIFVCESGPDGAPKLETARAFRAGAGVGVCYGRGVWHHRLSPLAAPARFAVVMTHAPEGQDTSFWDLPEPVTITG